MSVASGVFDDSTFGSVEGSPRSIRYPTYAEPASQYSRARRRIGRRGTPFLSSPFLAERDRIRNRISVVKKDQAQRGRYLGAIVPFGYTVNDDGALVEDAQQQAAIREMIVLKDKGKSLRTISEIIKKRGIAISHNAVGTCSRRPAKPPSSPVDGDSQPRWNPPGFFFAPVQGLLLRASGRAQV